LRLGTLKTKKFVNHSGWEFTRGLGLLGLGLLGLGLLGLFVTREVEERSAWYPIGDWPYKFIQNSKINYSLVGPNRASLGVFVDARLGGADLDGYTFPGGGIKTNGDG